MHAQQKAKYSRNVMNNLFGQNTDSVLSIVRRITTINLLKKETLTESLAALIIRSTNGIVAIPCIWSPHILWRPYRVITKVMHFGLNRKKYSCSKTSNFINKKKRRRERNLYWAKESRSIFKFFFSLSGCLQFSTNSSRGHQTNFSTRHSCASPIADEPKGAERRKGKKTHTRRSKGFWNYI